MRALVWSNYLTTLCDYSMASKDIQIAKIKANITLNDMNHSATLKVHKQINQIANKIIVMIRKMMPSMKISDSIIEFSDGYAIIRISDKYIDSLDEDNPEVFGDSLSSILSEIANRYNNTMMNIESSSIEGKHQEDTPEITSLNALIYKLKSLDPLSKVVVCGIKDKTLVSFAPTSLGVEVSNKGNEVLIKDIILGYVVTDSINPGELINYSDDTLINVRMQTLGSKHEFIVKLTFRQIQIIKPILFRISGKLSPKDGKKLQTLEEGFVIEN